MHESQPGDGLSISAAELKFKELFGTYYEPLVRYAYSTVQSVALAEEIVQEIFCRVWERKGPEGLWKINQAYLYAAVFNESVNLLKQRKRNSPFEDDQIESVAPRHTADEKQLQEAIRAALNDLPEHCRTIFHLSRNEGMKYREIAEKLGIAQKTVEAQMSKALKILRSRLSDYLPAILLLFIQVKK